MPVSNRWAMDPIDARVDTAFNQALRCVQYRLPKPEGYRAPGYVFAVGVRYGMVGIAAAHHLLITANDEEESKICAMLDGWPHLVEDHVRWEVLHRLPFATNSSVPRLISRISTLPLRGYLPLYRRLCPLSRAIELVGTALVKENRGMVVEGWPWLKRRSAIRQFQSTLQESNEFALHFFERRQAELEEVPEIALIGE